VLARLVLFLALRPLVFAVGALVLDHLPQLARDVFAGRQRRTFTGTAEPWGRIKVFRMRRRARLVLFA
jgi:hypothetical protein